MSKKTPPLPRLPGEDEPQETDRREYFSGLANKGVQSTEAERAFLTSKVELIREDSNLTEEERQRALAELQARIDLLSQMAGHPEE